MAEGRSLSWSARWSGAVVLLLLLVYVPTGLDIRWSHPGARDFVAYWSVPHAMSRGIDMYDPRTQQLLQEQVGYSAVTLMNTRYANLPLWNPPPLVLLLTPFGALDFSSGVLLWTAINLILLGHSIRAVSHALHFSTPVPRLIAVALLFVPGLHAIFWGQPTPALVAFALYAWLAHRRGRETATGLLLTPLLLKVHLFSVTILLFLIVATNLHRWKTIVSFVAANGLLTIALFIVQPNWSASWASQGLSSASTIAVFDLITLILDVPRSLALVGTFLGLTFVTVRYRNLHQIDIETLCKASMLSVLLSPYLWPHDLIVLLPAALIGVVVLFNQGWRLRLLVPPVLWWIPAIERDLILTYLSRFNLDHIRELEIAIPSPESQFLMRLFTILVLYAIYWIAATNRMRESVDAYNAGPIVSASRTSTRMHKVADD